MIMQVLILYYTWMSAGDLALTVVGLKWGFTENNPLMDSISHNLYLFSISKAIGATFAIWLAWRMWTRWPSTGHRIFSTIVFFILTILQSYATAHNLRRLLGY